MPPDSTAMRRSKLLMPLLNNILQLRQSQSGKSRSFAQRKKPQVSATIFSSLQLLGATHRNEREKSRFRSSPRFSAQLAIFQNCRTAANTLLIQAVRFQ
jgi:hypothetical protein